jgi:hypothetical protein
MNQSSHYSQYEDLLIDALLDDGFTLDEALRLIELQSRWQQERQPPTVERPRDLWREEPGEQQCN